ncbi:Bile acid:sodium symporter [Acetobacteraceae bacterium EV16G]|uniref:Bile acid:sodium symporter n=1 Tax=Sorlinia euscelidii TaxID=3081148 RepID=A0ABU7U0W8_9PROT
MIRPDPFLLALIAAILLATFVPSAGHAAAILNVIVTIMIGVMFFLQGARLEPASVIANVRDWRLQGTMLACTFILFPILGLGAWTLMPHFFSDDLWRGMMFLCCLPSTVQSSIALTSIARGNVAAAICGATLSNIVGIFVTPILVGLLVRKGQIFSLHAMIGVATQLLLPFLIGQLLHHRIGGWALRHKRLLSFTDRGSVILVVYTAFSHAVVEGIWHRISLADMVVIAIACFLLLVLVLLLTWGVGRKMHLTFESTIALMFCGSKKSLASGVPMANILFTPAHVGIVVLPLMLFHQIQLFTCTLLARKFARRSQAG